VRVELLLVPDCAKADRARIALAESLTELDLDVAVEEQVGDWSSPTVLVDGVDVMTGASGATAGYACRLDVPTTARITAALRWAASDPASPSAYPPQLAVGVTRDRIADVSPAARQLHRTILRAFARTGHAPDPATLPKPAGEDVGGLLAQLHEHDVLRLDEQGSIRTAYPFSGAPTPHVVAVDGGPAMYSMCAVDALGIHAMLGRDTLVTSVDPQSGESVEVVIRRGQAMWRPATALVFVGSDTTASAVPGAGCCPADGSTRACTVAAADRCCGVMNFFTSTDSARAWMAAHPQVSGVVLSQEQALRLGVDIFGRLLDD
jgi:Alkylmercury lyase